MFVLYAALLMLMENMNCSADDAVLDRARHAAVTVADIARLEQNREASLDTARVAAVLIDPKFILSSPKTTSRSTLSIVCVRFTTQ